MNIVVLLYPQIVFSGICQLSLLSINVNLLDIFTWTNCTKVSSNSPTEINEQFHIRQNALNLSILIV